LRIVKVQYCSSQNYNLLTLIRFNSIQSMELFHSSNNKLLIFQHRELELDAIGSELLRGNQADKRASSKSDIYAFAVIMWEIASFGYIQNDISPDPEKFRTIILAGGKYKSKPEYGVPIKIVNLINRSWAQTPHHRPSVESILQDLKEILHSGELPLPIEDCAFHQEI